jgi:hypothetical protein
MVHYFKQSCLLMLWALFLVNISFTSCDDKNPEVQIGELTTQASQRPVPRHEV